MSARWIVLCAWAVHGRNCDLSRIVDVEPATDNEAGMFDAGTGGHACLFCVKALPFLFAPPKATCTLLP